MDLNLVYVDEQTERLSCHKAAAAAAAANVELGYGLIPELDTDDKFAAQPEFNSPGSPSVLNRTPLSPSESASGQDEGAPAQVKPRGSWAPSRYITRRYENLDAKACKRQRFDLLITF
eukprot:750323-Hanusia_phi.AAC.3